MLSKLAGVSQSLPCSTQMELAQKAEAEKAAAVATKEAETAQVDRDATAPSAPDGEFPLAPLRLLLLLRPIDPAPTSLQRRQQRQCRLAWGLPGEAELGLRVGSRLGGAVSGRGPAGTASPFPR